MYQWQPIARSEHGYIARKPHNFHCWAGGAIKIVHFTSASFPEYVYDYYTDNDMRKLAQEVGLHVTPEWWQQWDSTRAWFDSIVNGKPEPNVFSLDAYFDADTHEEANAMFMEAVA